MQLFEQQSNETSSRCRKRAEEYCREHLGERVEVRYANGQVRYFRAGDIEGHVDYGQVRSVQ